MAYKKFTRSKTNSTIGGVCGGLGEYFDIDPVIFRILFLFLTLAAGGGLIIYLLLWIIVPIETQNYNYTNTPTTIIQNNENVEDETSATQSEQIQNEGTESYDTFKYKRNLTAGSIIVGLGIIFLTYNTFGLRFSKWWPLILVVTGIAIIAFSRQNSKIN